MTIIVITRFIKPSPPVLLRSYRVVAVFGHRTRRPRDVEIVMSRYFPESDVSFESLLAAAPLR